jgi:hypothetical protein
VKVSSSHILVICLSVPVSNYGVKVYLSQYSSGRTLVFGGEDESFPDGSRLCRGFSAVWFTLFQQVGDPQEIIGQHRSAH